MFAMLVTDILCSPSAFLTHTLRLRYSSAFAFLTFLPAFHTSPTCP